MSAVVPEALATAVRADDKLADGGWDKWPDAKRWQWVGEYVARQIAQAVLTNEHTNNLPVFLGTLAQWASVGAQAQVNADWSGYTK